MYPHPRIAPTGIFVSTTDYRGIARDVEMFAVLGMNLKDVLITTVGIEDAKKCLEFELKREALSCPNGKCED